MRRRKDLQERSTKDKKRRRDSGGKSKKDSNAKLRSVKLKRSDCGVKRLLVKKQPGSLNWQSMNVRNTRDKNKQEPQSKQKNCGESSKLKLLVRTICTKSNPRITHSGGTKAPASGFKLVSM